MQAMRKLVCASLGCALWFGAAPASAQLIEPIAQPTSPVRSDGVREGRKANDPAQLGRELDAASRRVQADTIDNQVRQADQQLERDRIGTDRDRATATPAEAVRLRQAFETERAQHESWRASKAKEKALLELPPPPSPPPVRELPPPPHGLDSDD